MSAASKDIRAKGKDIAELFGYRPDDTTAEALKPWNKRECPFTGRSCIKTIRKLDETSGVCSVSLNADGEASEDIIVCPQRMYENDHKILGEVVSSVWSKGRELVLGGALEELKAKAIKARNPVVAFGQHSGNEISIGDALGRQSMDWILQSYVLDADGQLQAEHFAGVEVQSIDITGNYIEPWQAYAALRGGEEVARVPSSGHGLNWANVHKRLLPQLIRKGNIYKHCKRCIGFYFLTPDTVFKRFEAILGDLKHASGPGRDVLSVITYKLSSPPPAVGQRRTLEPVRQLHLPLKGVANAFITFGTPEDSLKFENKLKNLLS